MAENGQADAIHRYYASDEKLRKLDTLQARYGLPQVDFPQWALGTVDWAGDEAVLDIGAGTGKYYRQLQQLGIDYTGIDLSPNLLRAHPSGAERLALGDAPRLPFRSAQFDVVMANHVLYHMADIDACLREIKRVLKPGGRLLASTDSLHTTPELQVLIRRAVILLSDNGGQVTNLSQPCDAFALENGTRILSRHFYAVARYDLPSRLRFTEAAAALEYLDCMRELRQQNLPPGIDWDDMMLIMQQQFSQLLTLMGALEIHVATGALVASDSGGFIHGAIAQEDPPLAS